MINRRSFIGYVAAAVVVPFLPAKDDVRLKLGARGKFDLSISDDLADMTLRPGDYNSRYDVVVTESEYESMNNEVYNYVDDDNTVTPIALRFKVLDDDHDNVFRSVTLPRVSNTNLYKKPGV